MKFQSRAFWFSYLLLIAVIAYYQQEVELGYSNLFYLYGGMVVTSIISFFACWSQDKFGWYKFNVLIEPKELKNKWLILIHKALQIFIVGFLSVTALRLVHPVFMYNATKLDLTKFFSGPFIDIIVRIWLVNLIVVLFQQCADDSGKINKKKLIKYTLFVILIVALLAAVVFGVVFWLLNLLASFLVHRFLH